MPNLNDFQHNFSQKVWVLIYTMVEYDSKRGLQIFPQVHGVYDDEWDARENLKAMSNPEQYHLTHAYKMRYVPPYSRE